MTFQQPCNVADFICTVILAAPAVWGLWVDDGAVKAVSIFWLMICAFSFYSIYVEWKEDR